MDWRSLSVIEAGTIRKLGYGFLFAFHMSLSCVVSVISEILVENSDFFIIPLRSTPLLKSKYCHTVWCGKSRIVWLGYRTVKKVYRQTDGHARSMCRCRAESNKKAAFNRSVDCRLAGWSCSRAAQVEHKSVISDVFFLRVTRRAAWKDKTNVAWRRHDFRCWGSVGRN